MCSVGENGSTEFSCLSKDERSERASELAPPPRVNVARTCQTPISLRSSSRERARNGKVIRLNAREELKKISAAFVVLTRVNRRIYR